MSPLSSFIADLLEDYQQAVPIEVVPDNARLLASQSERTMVAAVASSAPPPISEKKEYCRWTAKQQDEALLPPSRCQSPVPKKPAISVFEGMKLEDFKIQRTDALLAMRGAHMSSRSGSSILSSCSDLSYAELSMDEILGKAVQLFPSTSL
jgi:hypothetical protein